MKLVKKHEFPPCSECFDEFYAQQVQFYECKKCGIDVCRACRKFVKREWHGKFGNIFGCPHAIHSQQIRVFTSLWIIIYIILTPLLSLKFSADILRAIVSATLNQDLKEVLLEEEFFDTFETFVLMISSFEFWFWACLLYPVIWALITVCSVIFRTGMLFYQTFLCCKFRSNFGRHIWARSSAQDKYSFLNFKSAFSFSYSKKASKTIFMIMMNFISKKV